MYVVEFQRTSANVPHVRKDRNGKHVRRSEHELQIGLDSVRDQYTKIMNRLRIRDRLSKELHLVLRFMERLALSFAWTRPGKFSLAHAQLRTVDYSLLTAMLPKTPEALK